MYDFVNVGLVSDSKGKMTIVPNFLVVKSEDLMIRGGCFYAVWDGETGLWCKDQYRLMEVIDHEVKKGYETALETYEGVKVTPLYLRDFKSRRCNEWVNYPLPDVANFLDNRFRATSSQAFV